MPSLTLGELKERTAALFWRKQKAADKSESVADLVVAYFGSTTPIRLIDQKRINTFKLDLAAAGNTPATINRKLAALSKMLHLAADEDVIDKAPRIKREREGEGRVGFLADELEARMLATLRVWGAKEEHDLFMFLIDTGARLGEALKLRWSEVAATQVTFLGTKNYENRTIPLTKRVQEMLRQPEGGNPTTVKVFKVRSLRRLWAKLRAKLKLNDDPMFVIHILRHTCASRLLQRGADLEYVRRWLGHKNIKVTQRYAHLAPSSLDKLARLLEQPQVEKPRHLGVIEGGKHDETT